MPYTQQFTARFDEIDRGGVLYFANYYRFCHATLEDLMGQMLGEPLETAVQQGRWFSPIVHSEADYCHPVHLGERLTVGLSVQARSRRTVTYVFSIHNAAQVLCAKLRLVATFVSPQTRRAVDVPAHIVEGLRRHNLWPDAT